MVLTTHEYNTEGRCVGCGALARNANKRPNCKVLGGEPDQVDVSRYERIEVKRPSLLETPKKKFHHFGASDTCIYCGILLGNEPSKPLCPRNNNAAPKSILPKNAPAKKYEPCHVTHPVLKFGDLKIHGGSCNSPKVKNCDVYIGFDGGMHMTVDSMPWKRGTKGHVEEVYYHVSDMTAPKHPKEFVALVEWTLEQMKAGKKVHAGCIGGHGRTGTFFAALAATQTEVPVEDAIQFVRDNYCAKAVECPEQITFLKKHFGVKTEVKGSKSWTGTKATKKISTWADRWKDDDADFVAVVKPEKVSTNVWGRTLGEEDL